MRLPQLPQVDPEPAANALAYLDRTGWGSGQRADSNRLWRWLFQTAWATDSAGVGRPAVPGTIGARMLLAAGLGDLEVYADAAAAVVGGLLPGDLFRTPAGVIKSVSQSAVSAGVNPRQYGGTGNGLVDDTAAVAAAIDTVNASTGAWLDLSGGTWRLAGPVPVLTRPIVDGKGSGVLYADWAVDQAILTCRPHVPSDAFYTVNLIERVAYDAGGTFTIDSTVTRLNVVLGPGQVMPAKGTVCKLVSRDPIAGVDDADGCGQHFVVLDTAGTNYVYTATRFFDVYSAANPTMETQLIVLSEQLVQLRGFTVAGNWDRVVAEDWRASGLNVIGARYPVLADVAVRDLAQGIMLLGCWGAATRGLSAHRMRNATASEAPPVSGYGVMDAGSFGTVHVDLKAYDCRHGFTTVSPDMADWPKIAWGRSLLPSVMGGVGAGCSSSCFDAHSDCLYPSFLGLVAQGGYFGEHSDGCGFQLRGGYGRIIDCRAVETAHGVNIYKQFAGEPGGHHVDRFEYHGNGNGIRIDHESTLTPLQAQQRVRLGAVRILTGNVIGILAKDASIDFEGDVLVACTGNPDGPSAIENNQCALRSVGGRLIHDVRAQTDVAMSLPRLVSFNGAACSAPDLKAKVVVGSGVGWMAAVVENDNPAATGSGPWNIDVECDVPPTVAASIYSQFGSGNLLEAGTWRIRVAMDGAGVRPPSADPLALRNHHHGQIIVLTAAVSVSVAAAAVLGPAFQCWLYGDGAALTITGLTAGSNSLTAGQLGQILVANGKTILVKLN